MKVLLLGSGGREHAMAWKLSQSPLLEKLFIAPGNGGTGDLGRNVDLSTEDFDSIGKFVLGHGVGMVIVGPEAPLVDGIYDYFQSDAELSSVALIGPSKAGAMLEGSKRFANEFMQRHNIPTSGFFSVSNVNLDDGLTFLRRQQPPFVLKADGLASGKGVLILNDLAEAESELRQMLAGKFGKASSTVVIEEYMQGIEISVFALTDGDSYLLFPSAKDYKRIGEGDSGPNTGGMGAVSPVPFAGSRFMGKVEERIVRPTIRGLRKEGITYKGFIYFGLMNVGGDPMVVEYNVRLGDPETQVVLPRVKNDLLDLFMAVAQNDLGSRKVEISTETACTVVLVSGGYPDAYEKGKVIHNLEKVKDSIVFHAGTRTKDNTVISSGGRVLNVTSVGKDMQEALDRSYKNAELISFEKMYYRSDIGFDLK